MFSVGRIWSQFCCDYGNWVLYAPQLINLFEYIYRAIKTSRKNHWLKMRHFHVFASSESWCDYQPINPLLATEAQATDKCLNIFQNECWVEDSNLSYKSYSNASYVQWPEQNTQAFRKSANSWYSILRPAQWSVLNPILCGWTQWSWALLSQVSAIWTIFLITKI